MDDEIRQAKTILINEKRREKYASSREKILKKQKEDREMCPICNLSFRRLYLPKHMQRHALSE